MKNPITMNFLFFIGFLVMGYSISTRFYQPDYGEMSNTSSSFTLIKGSNSIQSLNSGQRYILLISVNSMNTSLVELKSIWLVTNLPPDTSLIFFPIINTGKGTNSDLDNKLVDSFKLENKNGNLVLSQEFIGILKENNFWWSGYIILDQAAVRGISHRIEAADNNVELSFASSIEISFLREICQRLSSTPVDSDNFKEFLYNQNHLLTDMDRNELFTEWKALISANPNPGCRFPTLEILQVNK